MSDAEWPRASLAIIAFNQIDYIDEAVGCALAQDYPNLQIILSDDHSTDGTFARMTALAQAYDGPHTIVLNQTEGGRGILAHFMDALKRADGVLMVGAAGDDMSAPHRVSTLMAAWRGRGAAGIYSAWNKVDVAGRFLARLGMEDHQDLALSAYFPNRQVVTAFGCTAGYDVSFLRSIPVPAGTIWSEDFFFSAVAMMTGADILYVDEALVAYRQNPAAMRNMAAGEVGGLDYEQRESRFCAGQADLLTAVLALVDGQVLPTRTRVDRDAIVRDIAWYRYRAEWMRCGLLDRLRYTATLRQRRQLRWAIPRLPGPRAFCRAKAALATFRGSAG